MTEPATTTIFDQNTTTQNQSAPTTTTTDPVEKTTIPVIPTVDTNANYADQLSAIKTEEGTTKYSNVSDALHALRSSQEHIKNLENENASYREEGKKAKTTDEILGLLDSRKTETADTQPQIDMEKLQNLVRDTITQTETDKLSLQNQTGVARTLANKFGEKAAEMYIEKANQLGIPIGMFDQQSATSPKAVLEFFGTKIQSNTSKNIQGSNNINELTATTKKYDPNIMKIFESATSPQVEMWRSVVSYMET